MTLRIACLVISPENSGGTEAAMKYAVQGLRDLGHDVEVLALSRGQGEWSTQCAEYIDRAVSTKAGALEAELDARNYDGIILSNAYFVAKPVSAPFISSTTIAPWTSGRHWNWESKAILEHHAIARRSPTWSRKYVSFWASAESEALAEVEWVRGVLPYVPQEKLHNLPPISERPIDFGFIGSVGPMKGALAFANGLERITRTDPSRKFTAEYAGNPMDKPGGPHVHEISTLFEKWGWKVERDNETRKTQWQATNPTTGSVVTYTGAFGSEDAAKVFGRVKCYVNVTSSKIAPAHLEYATMEALDAGCVVLAPDDWDKGPYLSSGEPSLYPVPRESVRILKGSRFVYNDTDEYAMEDSYARLGDRMAVIHQSFSLRPDSVDQEQVEWSERNREILRIAHDPKIAATAYLRALNLA